MKKVIEVPDEFSDDFVCQCGGRIVEGTRLPGGDYDDWLEKPHCELCGKESSSDKNPYEAFRPTFDVSDHQMDGLGREWRGGKLTGRQWHVDSIRDEAEFISRIAGESEDEWWDRTREWLNPPCDQCGLVGYHEGDCPNRGW